MTDEERYELVQLRKENAQRTLCEAKLMLDNGYWNGAVNRMYYACFYAVTALLIQHGIKAQTHSGVRQMLSLRACRHESFTTVLVAGQVLHVLSGCDEGMACHCMSSVV